MTKLEEWLVVGGALSFFWFGLIFNKDKFEFTHHQYILLLLAPIIVLAIFGLSSLALVLYRVFTFNDCHEAATELQKEIVEAKDELKKKGFKFAT